MRSITNNLRLYYHRLVTCCKTERPDSFENQIRIKELSVFLYFWWPILKILYCYRIIVIMMIIIIIIIYIFVNIYVYCTIYSFRRITINVLVTTHIIIIMYLCYIKFNRIVEDMNCFNIDVVGILLCHPFISFDLNTTKEIVCKQINTTSDYNMK